MRRILDFRTRGVRCWLLAAAVLGTSGAVGAARPAPPNDRAVVHVLNRLAFGPRPGDVERVRAMGLDRYIDAQLHPERIDDRQMAEHLAGLQTTTLSSREIAERFEEPLVEARRARASGKADGGDHAERGDKPDRTPEPDPPVRMAQQEANRVVVELGEQKILRAVYSERQLQEVLADFWFNHFNVDARKGADRFLLTEYEREAIRPHVLGRFRDLLEATAKSPAMLFYLDNWMSVDPNGPHPQAMPPRVSRGPFGGIRVVPRPPRMPRPGPNAPKGLNENYGRELMELHTLGVDGGYTQKDVTEVARAFTGWTIDRPRQGGGFRFDPRRHDEGPKVVLGHVIKPGGGENDGEQVLDILARHPSTARFIATKLVRHFVSDAPPAALVDRAARRFQETDGDIREVMRTILTSPEFQAPEAYRAKVKTPFEFVVSALRATGAGVSNAAALVRAVQQLGMPLYQCQPPTGYSDAAEAWVNTGALVNRMNFALQLAGGRLPGIAPSTLDHLTAVMADDVSETTRATIARASEPEQAAALTLGAPEFQKR
ncbi:MAG TPA: DUF1800 domain-containing protein [Vicinamibacterales bacterium]|nr:DUF1800 domain-containing protein [Vicinamibacterales bacterium]